MISKFFLVTRLTPFMREVGLICCAALLLSLFPSVGKAFLARRFPSDVGSPNSRPAEIGRVVTFDGVPLRARVLTAVLFTSTSCRYSIDNVARHEALAKSLQEKGVPFYRVDVSTFSSIVSSLSFSPTSVYRQMEMALTHSYRLSHFNVIPPATPAIILLDHTGVIRKTFVGTLRARTQQPLLDALLAGVTPDITGEMYWRDHASLIEAWGHTRPSLSDAVIIDVRERDLYALTHHPQTLNIPLYELEVRAPIEVPEGRSVVLDCTYSNWGLCDMGQQLLNGTGLKSEILESSAIESSCSYSEVK